MIVGHIPRKISSVFFFYFGGEVDIQMTGGRRYSADLLQAGLEIPCTITVLKRMYRRFISAALMPPAASESLQPDKKDRLFGR